MGAEQYREHHEQMLEEEIPEDERFDWQTTKALCVGDVKKHKAYGMNIEEYVKNRRAYMDADDSERKRMSFYLPLFPSMVNIDMANMLGLSIHRFTIAIIELGLINFQVDYHSKYSIAKATRKGFHRLVTNQRTQTLYMQAEKQTINLRSAAGTRAGGSKHHSPSVPMWLYDAVVEVSTNLNMSMSDLIYLCWCIGVSKTIPQDCSCVVLDKDIINIIDVFVIELNMYVKRIEDLKSELHTCD